MKNGLRKTRSPTDLIDIYKDGLRKYTPLLIRECSCMQDVSAHMANPSGRISGKKRKKRSICGIPDKETQRILTNARKASTDTLPKSAMAQNAQHTDNFFI
jgi:hypothetical protein